MSQYIQSPGNQSNLSSSIPLQSHPITPEVRTIASAAQNALPQTSASPAPLPPITATEPSSSGAQRTAALGLEILRDLPADAQDAPVIICLMLKMACKADRMQNPERIFHCLNQCRNVPLNAPTLFNICTFLKFILSKAGASLNVSQQDAETVYLFATNLCMQGENLPNLAEALSVVVILAEKYPRSFVKIEICNSFISCLLSQIAANAAKTPAIMTSSEAAIAAKKLAPEHISLVFRLIRSGQIKSLTPSQNEIMASIIISQNLIYDINLLYKDVRMPGLGDSFLLKPEVSLEKRLEVCSEWRNACTPLSKEARERLVEILKSFTKPNEEFYQIRDAIQIYANLVHDPRHEDMIFIRTLLNQVKHFNTTSVLGAIEPFSSNPVWEGSSFLGELFAEVLEHALLDVSMFPCLLPGSEWSGYRPKKSPYQIVRRLAAKKIESKPLIRLFVHSLQSITQLQTHSEAEKISIAFFLGGLFVDYFPNEDSSVLQATFRDLEKMFFGQKRNQNPVLFESLASKLVEHFASLNATAEATHLLLVGLELLVRSGHMTSLRDIYAAETFDLIMQNCARAIQSNDDNTLDYGCMIDEIFYTLSQLAKHRLIPFCKACPHWIGSCIRLFNKASHGIAMNMITPLGTLAAFGHVQLLSYISPNDMLELFRTCREQTSDSDTVDPKFLFALGQLMTSQLFPREEIFLWKRMCQRLLLKACEEKQDIKSASELSYFVQAFPQVLESEDPPGMHWPADTGKPLTKQELTRLHELVAMMMDKNPRYMGRRQIDPNISLSKIKKSKLLFA